MTLMMMMIRNKDDIADDYIKITLMMMTMMNKNDSADDKIR